jgi:hypothetical protein
MELTTPSFQGHSEPVLQSCGSGEQLWLWRAAALHLRGESLPWVGLNTISTTTTTAAAQSPLGMHTAILPDITENKGRSNAVTQLTPAIPSSENKNL